MLTKPAFLVVALLAFAAPAFADGYEAKPMTVAEMQATGGLIVDIRAPEEWADTGVIAGAKLLTFTDAQSFIATLGADLSGNRPLILVCRSGRRSAAAAEALQSMIPNPIISVDGGMNLVIDAGYQPVAP